jgi:usherin
VNQLCDPLSGQCACKKEAKGLKCDSCRENFYGLPWSACEVCDCSKAGSQPGTVCDTETGQCVCKPNVGGRQCSQCKAGYFNLYQNDSHLCLTCNCEKMGTVNGSLRCDKSTGQCPCKLGVTGLRCHQCKPHRFNLTMDNPQGCQACDCDSLGTLPGSMCDPISGQCLCLPHRQGRRCEQCQPGKRGSLSVQGPQMIPISGFSFWRLYVQHHCCVYTIQTELFDLLETFWSVCILFVGKGATLEESNILPARGML